MGENKSARVRETAEEKFARMTAFDGEYGGIVCGVDEAGRGPLVGPVSVCACIMPKDVKLLGIDDSKKLSETKREALYEEIIKVADYCVVFIDSQTIDKINILEATKLGMKRAIEGLKKKPDVAIVDAVKNLDVTVRCEPVIKADAKSYSVAAASVIAKVTRDRFMRELDIKYPAYGFNKNKGYGTKEHIAALKAFGPIPEHRRSFIKNFVNEAAATIDD
ncbi:MAG: ribonuclease HII [Clostridiales bacterium]|nr:ribonuclease HII [Clostridiales bacterium]